MALAARSSPQGKPVALFVTCMVDMLFPGTGQATVDLLRHQGLTVTFPRGQTCCGQPAFNSGYLPEARKVARQFLKAFADSEVIVTPSGSCAAMLRHDYPALFADDPVWGPEAARIAASTWELTEFLVDGLGVDDLGLNLPAPHTFAFHDSCHGLRLLGLGEAARRLLGHVGNARIVELQDNDECCGFGGLFSVKLPDISSAMLQNKIDRVLACEAETIVLGDVSCMAHINGGLARQGSSKRVRHIADVLAAGLAERQARA